MPSVSCSISSSSESLYSAMSGSSTKLWRMLSAPPRSNRLSWPAAACFLSAAATLNAFSYTAISCERFAPVLSKQPTFIMASTIRLFISAALLTKSIKSVKRPFLSRSAIISFIAPSPTLRMPASPKRIAPFSTLNFSRLMFISGGSTFIPMRFDAPM